MTRLTRSPYICTALLVLVAIYFAFVNTLWGIRYKAPVNRYEASRCAATIQDILSGRDTSIRVRMAAIPHTASSSTDRVFQASTIAWNNTSSLSKRGFSCPAGKAVTAFHGECDMFSSPSNVTEALTNTLSRLHYLRKTHSNYNQVMRQLEGMEGIFTILRNPETTVMSQYGMRRVWDQMWSSQYPNARNVTDTSVYEWVAKAWWRHNLFTKMLATDTRVIWVRKVSKTFNYSPLVPSKDESDSENRLGEQSRWLGVALSRLKEMPFFGLFHRLSESFELMGFHLCFPVNATGNQHTRTVDKELASIVQKHFVLDSLLLERADVLFDELVDDMLRKKQQGILCDLGAVLKQGQSEFGLKCV